MRGGTGGLPDDESTNDDDDEDDIHAERLCYLLRVIAWVKLGARRQQAVKVDLSKGGNAN